MQTTTRINTPVLTEIAQPSSNLFLIDLSNADHPVNNKALSGKREGMSCMIDGVIHVATGSNASDPWDELGGGYRVEGSFLSIITQSGVEDTPTTIDFGAGGETINGHLSVSSDGEITVLNSGYFAFKQRFRAKRSGASGYSELFFWVEVSVNGGVDWSIIGTSVDLSLNNSNETTVFFDIALAYFQAGIKLRNRFARSSTGDDSGDLVEGTPSAALSTAGVPIAPSAQITIYPMK